MPSLHGSHFLERNPVSHLKTSISLFLGGITFDANVWLIFAGYPKKTVHVWSLVSIFWDAVITWWVKSYGNKGWIHHLWDTGNKRCFFFKVYEEVLGLLDFLHFFFITFTLEDETPLIDFQIKKTNPTPGLLFQTQKKQVVSKWAGLKNKTKTSIIPWKKKKTMHAIIFGGGHPLFWVLFRSPPRLANHQKNPSNLRFAQNRHPTHLGGAQHHLANELTFAALRGVSWGNIQVVKGLEGVRWFCRFSRSVVATLTFIGKGKWIGNHDFQVPC